MEKILDRVRKVIKDNIKEFEYISDYIFKNPELSGEEYKAAEFLSETLKENGFKVCFPLEHVPTAFVAEYGDRKKSDFVVAFPAEYDALPGYGPDGEPGHACGHNWIAATMCGCGIVLSKFAEETGIIVKVIGTPAEETLGSKYDLCEAGIFDDVNIVLQAHPAEASCLETKTLALNSMEFTFHGKAAHAAQFPELGINALDGVLHLFSGINSLRQHVRSDVRIHGIITAGGEAPNVVPDFAQCRFHIRAADKKYLNEVKAKIIGIAKGASEMTGADLEFREYENPYDDIRNNHELINCVQHHLETAGISDFVPGYKYDTPGSSDIGNVSYVSPTIYFEVDLEGEYTCIVHDPSALGIVNSDAAYRKMEQVIEGFVTAAIEIREDSDLYSRIKEEFKNEVR